MFPLYQQTEREGMSVIQKMQDPKNIPRGESDTLMREQP